MAVLSSRAILPTFVRAEGRGVARLQSLRSVPELDSLGSSELAFLLSYVDEVEVGPGSRIGVEGEPCSQLVIVQCGCLRATSKGGDTRRLGPGDRWGWSEMWNRSTSESSLVAETGARLLVMGHAQFRAVRSVLTLPG